MEYNGRQNERQSVTTWLNGNQMIELKDEKIGAATGKIALTNT